jgi:hypothetical protein
MNQIFIEDVVSKETNPDLFWKTWAISDECKICGIHGSRTLLYACWTVDTIKYPPNNGGALTTTGYKGAVCASKLCQEMMVLQNI